MTVECRISKEREKGTVSAKSERKVQYQQRERERYSISKEREKGTVFDRKQQREHVPI